MLDPQNPNWWIAVANTAVHTNLTEALASYIKAVNLDPTSDVYWFALATFCIENKVYIQDFGLDAALHAYAINPSNPENMDILGQMQMEIGQFSSAETMFSRAWVSSIQDSSKMKYQFHLGLLYLQMYRLDDAKIELENILRMDPNGNYGTQAKILIERFFP